MLRALEAGAPGKYVVIIEDAIIAVPARAKPLVARYCQNANARLWREYDERLARSNSEESRAPTENGFLSLLKRPLRSVYRRAIERRGGGEKKS